MKVSPQPRVSALLRIFAGTCALLWLAGIAVCGRERVYNCAGHEEASASHPTPAHDLDTVVRPEQGHAPEAEPHHDAEAQQHAMASHHYGGAAQHEHGGNRKKGCDEKTCCSTMMALLPTANPIVIANSISPQVFFVCLLNAGPELAAPNCEAVCQTKPRDWVFMPKVCLGPAHRSLAPPSLA